MAGLIPRSFIDELLSRIDIVEVISSRVQLKRRGGNFVGLCPFHNEKTPSFTVSQSKQFYHCFGCGASGSAVNFLMQFDRLNFVEAVENLAAQAGLPIPQHEQILGSDRHANLYEANEKAAQFYEQQLLKSPRAIQYLKARGITDKIRRQFRIGYAPDNWENLLPLYAQATETREAMLQAGLLATKNNRVYSRLRDRIIFPIRNSRGKIIGFGGRTLGNDPAKYLNSPETPIFHKSRELYGLYEAQKSQNPSKNLLVVEGYLDTIALSQFGLTNAVATLGTAISPQQINLLLRRAAEITFCFDGDRAGRIAAWRALINALPHLRDGIEIKFLFLPEDSDPDELVRKSPEQFRNMLNSSQIPLPDLLVQRLIHKIDLTTLGGRSKLIHNSRNLIRQLPRGIFAQVLAQRIAQLAQISPEELIHDTHENAPYLPPQPTSLPSQTTIAPPIQKLLQILVHYPQYVEQLASPQLEISTLDWGKLARIPGGTLLQELSELLTRNIVPTPGAMLEHWRDRPEQATLTTLIQQEPIIPHKGLKNEVNGIIQLLIRASQENEICELMNKAATQKLNDQERLQLQFLIKESKKIG